MIGGPGHLAGTLIARILSDDLYGDIPGRRLATAGFIARLSEEEEPSRWLQRLWILNRVRNTDLLCQYRELLRCYSPSTARLRGESVIVYSSGFNNTRIVELPFDRAALDACPDRTAALRYLANPNVGRNAALAFGQSCGARRTFVLDGDIYVPRPTFDQTARLIAEYGPDCPVWLFTIRAWTLEEFAASLPAESRRQPLADACGSEFVFDSWPPEVIHLGDEGMLGLPADSVDFDEAREYSNDPKVAYCTMLRAGGRRILTPSYPVCHLEHRTPPVVAMTPNPNDQEQARLEHRLSIRAAAKQEMLAGWQPAGTGGQLSRFSESPPS
jgi:hypothetical protein